MKGSYLDNNASTPIDPHVATVIQEALSLQGNASSVHTFGQEVRNQIAKARRRIATFFGVRSSEVVFTSGATEGMNLLLRGFFGRECRGHIITSNVEHSCVETTVQDLERAGCPATYLPAGLYGAVTVEQVAEAIRSETCCIVLLAANNETGVITDIEAIAALAEERQIPLFVDGVALLGKEEWDLPKGVTGISFSGHKVHAPQGVGCTIVRPSCRLVPLQTGGGQELGRRGGTENVIGILALAEAIQQLSEDLPQAVSRMRRLRDRLENAVQEELEGVFVNGTGPRVSNTTNLSFAGVDGETLLLNFDLQGLAVSHGSACSSGALEPSRIFVNMGVSPELAKSAIRFSLSRMTTEEEVDEATRIVVTTVRRLRRMG